MRIQNFKLDAFEASGHTLKMPEAAFNQTVQIGIVVRDLDAAVQ